MGAIRKELEIVTPVEIQTCGDNIVKAVYFSFDNKFPVNKKFLQDTTHVFVKHEHKINSLDDDCVGKRNRSNDVLAFIRENLKCRGWKVEEGKRINLPVPYGKINPDAQYPDLQAILEVEGPRACVANAWAKDLAKAMQAGQKYLILAVRQNYTAGKNKPSNDFNKIKKELRNFKDLPIKVILLIGY